MSKNKKAIPDSVLVWVCKISASAIMCIFIAIGVFFSAFTWGYWARYLLTPNYFTDTTWSTEDGDIQFTVDMEKKVIRFSEERYDYVSACLFGTAKIDGTEYEFFVDEFNPESFFRFVNMDIVEYYEQGGTDDYNDIVDEYTLFCARAEKYRPKKFVCEVYMSEEGGILPEGTKIEFRRMD